LLHRETRCRSMITAEDDRGQNPESNRASQEQTPTSLLGETSQGRQTGFEMHAMSETSHDTAPIGRFGPEVTEVRSSHHSDNPGGSGFLLAAYATLKHVGRGESPDLLGQSARHAVSTRKRYGFAPSEGSS